MAIAVHLQPLQAEGPGRSSLYVIAVEALNENVATAVDEIQGTQRLVAHRERPAHRAATLRCRLQGKQQQGGVRRAGFITPYSRKVGNERLAP